MALTKIMFPLRTYEPVRHEPVRRAELAYQAANRFSRVFFVILPKNKLIKSFWVKRGMNRFMPRFENQRKSTH